MISILFRALSAATIAISMGSSALAQTTNEAAAQPEQVSAQEIPNFHWLEDGSVFRGGRPKAAGIEELAHLNITAVIDLQGGDLHGKNFVINIFNRLTEPGERKSAIREEEKQVTAAGMEFFSMPLNSHDRFEGPEAKTIDEVLELLHARENQPVFIHCSHGRDRTGLIMALYQVKYRGLTPEAAYQEMREYGHKGIFVKLFTGQVDTYFWAMAPMYAAQRTAR